MTEFLVVGAPARQEFLEGYAMGLKHNSEYPADTYEPVADAACPPGTIYIVEKDKFDYALADFGNDGEWTPPA
jgi:hypothetical protein